MSPQRKTKTKTKTATRNTTKDYDASDVKHLMDVKSWKNYDEMIAWLKRDGYDDNELTPGEVDHLLADLNRIKKTRADFTTDPDRLCDMLKASR